jgi:hypothetical protein
MQFDRMKLRAFITTLLGAAAATDRAGREEVVETRSGIAFLVFVGAALGAAAGLSIASADTQTAPRPNIPPLTLAEHGYFFVGGQYVESGGKRLMAGQMYVEYLTPQNVTHPYPIIMIHGTGQTGTNFMDTPDGRPGWAHNFLARGYRVYVVDQVGRGRSGADPQIYGAYMRFGVELEEAPFTAPQTSFIHKPLCIRSGRADLVSLVIPLSTSSTPHNSRASPAR